MNGCVLLGIFSRTGSSAFIVGLPILAYGIVRLILPCLRPAAALSVAGGTTLLTAGLLLIGSGQTYRRPIFRPVPHTLPSSAGVPPPPQRAATSPSPKASAGATDSWPDAAALPPLDGHGHYQAALHHLRQTHNTTGSVRHLEQALRKFPPDTLWHRRTQQLLRQVREKRP